MAAYLIDYENVKSEGIRGILQLSEDDTVIIFYSNNADTLTFETMDMIFASKATVRKYKIVRGGKNALDFQLSTYLGYLIHEGKDSCFYIISRDNGFQHLVEFWKRTFNYEGYVYCFPTIADAYARQRRLNSASAKEQAKAMEEELLAIQNLPVEEETFDETASFDAPPVKEGDLSAAESDLTVQDEPAEEENTSDAAFTDDAIEEEVFSDAEPVIFKEPASPAEEPASDSAVESAPSFEAEPASDDSDQFITEVIHQDTFITEPVSDSEDEPAILQEHTAPAAFTDSIAEKIAAAVPDSMLKVTVIENSVTVHQVQDNTEPDTGKDIQEENKTKADAADAAAGSAPEADAVSANNASFVQDSSSEQEAASSASGTNVSEQTASADAAPEAPAPRKPRRTSVRRKAPVAEEKAAEPVKEQEEEKAHKKPVHRGGRRKKAAAAPAAETTGQTAAPAEAPVPEPVPAASAENEPKRRPRTTGQRGRRPKTQKSEAAAFTD